MKNRKLYESIQRLVHKKDLVKKSKLNFAEEYCKQQMRKKKLIPRHSTSKIDDLMKNFKKINTFIGVDELLRVVNELYLQEEKQMKREIICKKQLSTTSSHKKNNSQVSEPSVIHKARDALKDYHQHLYNQQNNKVVQVISQFQRNSHYLGQTMKNKQKYGFLTKLINQKKNLTLQKIKDNEQQIKQKWNLYSRANHYTKTQPNQQNFKIQSNFSATNGYKKKKKMFQLAQIYLQMILQEQYRKKWNKQGNSNFIQFKANFNHINESETNKRSSILKKCASKQNLQLQMPQSKNSSENSSQINSEVLKVYQKNGFSQIDSTMTSYFGKSRRQQSRSNTKILRHKEIAIQKVNNFLMELEEDENCLKNEKKLHLYHLDRLEKQFDEHRLLKSNKIWKDEQKCEQIKIALQRQDKK